MTEGMTCDPDRLVALMKEGDLTSLDAMSRCYGARLVEVGRRYCRTTEDADEAVQDTYVQASRHLQSFRGDGSVEGWLVRMVINACRQKARGRKNDANLHTTEAVLPAVNAGPEALAGRGELAEALGNALLSLSADDRTLVLLSDAEGWTGPEIADRTGMTAGAVRTRLSRARKRLRETLEETGFGA
ncbi:MAG: RNA polymerase sigma factor (sigma-70 family) [Myxococcota bacterium]